MKKNILYLLLLTLVGGLLVIMGLPSGGDAPNILETYALGYLTILSGPFAVWFFPFYHDILFQLIATSIGIFMITLWLYMVKKEYAFWKIFILLAIWAMLGGLALFVEIISHI